MPAKKDNTQTYYLIIMTLLTHPTFLLLKRLTLLASLLLLTACATVNGPGDKRDPFESVNRSVFKFNEGFYQYVLDPVTETYQDLAPQPVQSGVSNFFSNIDDLFVLVNDLLQFKFAQAASDFSRFAFNTTAGLFGLIDVASHMDLPKHHEDFGQTLATWGVGSGPYLVIPFLGPRTLRGTSDVVASIYYDPIYDIPDREARWDTIGLKAIDTRAGLIQADRIAGKSGVDKYNFIRDAYLQHRRNLVYDGNPPNQLKPAPVNTKEDEELEMELEKSLQTPSQ